MHILGTSQGVGSVDAIGSQRPDLSVVVPAFNEEHRLPTLLGALQSQLDHATTEVVLVDDGSHDATSEVAYRSLAAMPRARVVRLEQNLGKGGAVRAGVKEASGRIVAYMDADCATDLVSLNSLTTALAGADISIGSRAHDASIVEHARLDRAVMGRIFNRLTRSLAGFDHRDTQCGFKAFHRPVAKLLFAMSSVDGFAFDVEILHLAHKFGFRVVEAPVHWQHVSGSKIRPWTDSFSRAADT
jgi:dolichyl-phosphate beta-glucosyltransferase